MKAVVLSLLVLSFAVGEQTFHLLKDRWQMKGGSTSFSPLEQFQNAKIIWKYDNYEKKWLALSVADTDADTINQKISENGYEYITSIDAGEGFWIYNNSVQTVHVEEPSTQYTKLSLQSGWNFISSTVLQDIDLNTLLLPSCVDILWHYNDDNRYAFSNKTAIKDAIESNAIDLYTTITPTDGFWAFSNANTCILDYEKTNQLFIESSKNVLCPGDSVNLSANTNLYESYSWSTQEGTFLAPESQLTEFTLPVDISSGVYNIRLDATLASQQYSAEKNIEVVDAQQSQWHKTAGPNGGDTIKLAQAGEKLLLSTTGGKIFSSSNQGESWELLYDFKNNATVLDLYTASLNDNYIYALSNNIFYSTDGGNSFNTLTTVEIPSSIYLTQNDTLLAGSFDGKLYKFENNNLSAAPIFLNESFNGKIEKIRALGDTIYIIVEQEGRKLYQSLDFGQTWSEITNMSNDATRSGPDSIYIDNERVYVGMIDYQNEPFSQNGDTNYFLVSSDAAQSWNNIILPTTDAMVNIIGKHPYNGKFYVNSGGALFSSFDLSQWNEETPLQRLVDDHPTAWFDLNSDTMILTARSGVVKGYEDTWEHKISGISNVGISLLNTKDNNSIYATSAAGEGLFKSSDYGKSWDVITQNGITHPWLDEIVVNPYNTQEVWAIADVGEVFQSYNGGDSFQQVINPYGQGFRYGSIYAFDIAANGSIYALKNGFGIFKSSQPDEHNSYNWEFLNNTEIDYSYSIVTDKTNPEVAYAASLPKFFEDNAFIAKTQDGGQNWEKVYEMSPTKGFTSLAIDPSNADNIYAASVGKDAAIFSSSDAGASWQKLSNSITFNNFHYVSTSHSNADIAYAAAWGAGVYKTIDGGQTWQKLESIPSVSISQIIEDPNNANTLYASDRTKPIVYKSVDGGQTWSEYFNAGGSYYRVLHLEVSKSDNGVIYTSMFDLHNPLKGGLFKVKNGQGSLINQTLPIMSLVLKTDPVDPNTLYTITHSQGVYKSVDGGNSWSSIVTGQIPDIGYNNIIIDKDDPQKLYLVGGSDIYFEGGEYKTQGISKELMHNVYISNDAGNSWSDLGLNAQIGDVKDLITSPNGLIAVGAQGAAFYDQNSWQISSSPLHKNFLSIASSSDKAKAYIASATGGVYNASLNSPLQIDAASTINYAIDHLLIKVDPNDADILYASAYPGGVFKSIDKGQTWSEQNFAMPSFKVTDPQKQGYYALDIALTDSQTLYLGTYGKGVLKSTDGARTWRGVNGVNSAMYNAKVFDLKIDPYNKDIVYAATTEGVFQTKDGGASWNAFNNGLAAMEVKTLGFNSSGKLFAGTLGNEMYRYDASSQKWQQLAAFGNYGAHWSMWDRPLYQYTTMIFDPDEQNTLYIGTFPAGIYKSQDAGISWSEKNVGWTNDGVFSLVFHPQNSNTLYSGTYNGVNVSYDKGETWELLNNGWPDEQWVFSIDFDKNDPDIMYACSKNGENKGNGVEGFKGTVMKSEDGGKSWYPITNGLDLDQEYYKIIVDKFDTNTLYLASQYDGVFISHDGGQSWSPWSQGLEGEVAGTNGNNVTDVLKLSNDGLYLYFGTFSSGVYKRLSDGALEQLGCE